MTTPREIVPVGGSVNDMVNHGIVTGQQEINTKVIRDKDLTVKGAFSIVGQFLVEPTTPPALTADVADYVIPGIGSERTSVVRISGGFRITGMKARPNEMRWMINVGSASVLFQHEDVSSRAPNRIITPTGLTVIVLTRESVVFWYDNDVDVQRWRMLQVP